MSGPPKQPVPNYWIIEGVREDITNEDSRAVIKADAAGHLGVVISEKHKFMKARAEIPDNVDDRTVMMYTPKQTPGTIELGVCYVTNKTWWIGGKKFEGHALILMLGAGGPGKPYNNIKITLDGTTNEVKGAFVYLPET